MIDYTKIPTFPNSILWTVLPTIETLSSHQVAPPFRKPFIYTGYRLTDQPWSYYWKSVFQLHNETAIVWLHVAAIILVLSNMCEYFSTYDMLRDKYALSLMGLSIGNLLGVVLSSIAHNFHSMSIWCHYVLSMLEYSGVTFYTFGTGLGYMCICSDKDVYDTMEPVFLPLSVCLSVSTFYMCCRARLHSRTHGWPKRVLICSVVFHAAVISVPVLARYECISLTECSRTSLKDLMWCFAVPMLATVVIVGHFPERFFPGWFDLVGHGHSLFHLVSLWTMHNQFEEVKVHISEGKTAHTEPSLIAILSAYVIIISAQVVTLLYLGKAIKTEVVKDTIIWEALQSKAND